MSIFGDLGRDNLADSATDPKRLFRALPKPKGSRFQFPYDIQSEVWDGWFARRNEPDLVVKMNTGSGKTVIGLVILKACLNEKKGPAVYLVPNRQLQKQVETTAAELGIVTARKPGDAIFRRGQAILVVTAAKMYNGLTTFGLRGAQTRPIPVGSIVIDDAHACIPDIEEQFAVTIEQDAPAYGTLLNLFADGLKVQSLPGYAGLSKGEGTQAVPVPYWDWQQQVETVFATVDEQSAEPQVKFGWPLIREHLVLCDATFSPSGLEIRLPLPDLSVVPSFTSAQRRIYMTATLADDSVLTTKMGVAPASVTRPIVPASASDLGDRIILTPVETSAEVSVDDVRARAVAWAEKHNVVVIVPSRVRGEVWRAFTTEIHDKTTIESVVQRLTEEHVGLVVLIARYDGIDLPEAACRILIMDGLPERYSPHELVEAVALGGTDAMAGQQVQRIEQGIGRGVRSNDDYCAVLLLDPRLVERLYEAASISQLSPGTRAQYDLSVQFSDRGRGKSMQFFDDAIDAFLSRDPSWVQASKQALEDVTYDHLAAVPPTATAQRDAFELALAGRYLEAKAAFDPVYPTITDARLRGWLKQRAAGYLNLVQPVPAREMQRSARIDNNFILKIPNEVAVPRLSAVADQAAATVAHLTGTYTSARDLQIGVEALLRDLVPTVEQGSYNRFENAFEQLGRILGFASSRPDQQNGIGPDNFWAIGYDRYWVVEAKSEATAAQVSRDYLEQLSHSMDWFEADYPEPRHTALPVMIHPSRQPTWNAVPRQGARVITFARLERLRDAVGRFTAALLPDGGYAVKDLVAQNLNQFGLNAGSLQQRWTEPFLPPATQ